MKVNFRVSMYHEGWASSDDKAVGMNFMIDRDNESFVFMNPANLWEEGGKTYNGFVENLITTTLCEYICTQCQKECPQEEHDEAEECICPEGTLYLTDALCFSMGLFERMIMGCPCEKLAKKMLRDYE